MTTTNSPLSRTRFFLFFTFLLASLVPGIAAATVPRPAAPTAALILTASAFTWKNAAVAAVDAEDDDMYDAGHGAAEGAAVDEEHDDMYDASDGAVWETGESADYSEDEDGVEEYDEEEYSAYEL